MNDSEMSYIGTQEAFRIDNDKKADWAIAQIKEAEEERDRLISLAAMQIEELEDRIEELTSKCENETKYLKSLLAQYFETVPHKETKTLETYKLLSGSLIYKKPSTKINHDDEILVELYAGTDLVETKKSFRWGEFKKDLLIDDGKVIDTVTGEILDCCTVEEVPASFDIKY